MIFYFLPGNGRFGGIKVGCQFVELLNAVDLPAVAVLPDGMAPQWFFCTAPVIGEDEALRRLSASDWKMITWPPDHARLRALPGRMVNHCQGTDPLMDPVFADPGVAILTCWEQAAGYVRAQHRRSTVHVGIHVSARFFRHSPARDDLAVACMPRRGRAIIDACRARCPQLPWRGIADLDEAQVAEVMQSSGIYLATSVGEQFGLPALEAMAAGCAVLSVPVRGGIEYLVHGHNALVAEPGELPELLEWLVAPARASLRARFRRNARATAGAWRRIFQLQHLQSIRGTALEYLAA